MATKTYNIPINGSWSATYPMTLTANVTEDTQGNTRKVNASLSIYANGEGFSNYNNAWEGNLKAYISIAGNNSNTVQIQTIPTSGTSVNLGSYSAYIEAGQTITVTGYFYCAYDNSFMPKQGWSSVSITLELEALQSLLGTISDFTIEDEFEVPVTKYNPVFTDTLNIKIGDTVIKSITNYESGTKIFFTPNELLLIYNQVNNSTKNITFTFVLYTRSTEALIGTSTANANGLIVGTVRVNVNGDWKRGIPWVNVNGSWERGVAHTNVAGAWERGV